MGAAPVYPWIPWITSFTLMSNRRQKEEEHKSKDLHKLRNLRRLTPRPATPTLRVSLSLWFPSSSLSFLLLCFIRLCLFSVCVPFCHVRRAPAQHPTPPPRRPAAPPPSSCSSIPTHTLAETSVFRLKTRHRSSVCAQQFPRVKQLLSEQFNSSRYLFLLTSGTCSTFTNTTWRIVLQWSVDWKHIL